MNENTFASESIFTTFACLLDILQANAMDRLKPILYATMAVEQFQTVMSPLQTRNKCHTWKELLNQSGLFMSKYVWLNRYSTGNDRIPVSVQGRKQTQTYTYYYAQHTRSQTQWHTCRTPHLQPREVMKTNGRVLFPLGSKEELSHQANFILVWPRDSISSGCFYKCRAAPRHRLVMDMRAWWPDGRCWPCNSSSKHSLMTPPPHTHTRTMSVPHSVQSHYSHCISSPS